MAGKDATSSILASASKDASIMAEQLPAHSTIDSSGWLN
jgi:hypothetical protein